MSIPKITVLMSVYNSKLYLKESIDSIINQTYKDFEFLIINDCSTDGSLEIIKSYKDGRIILVNNEINIGLTKSLNKGIKLARGEYIVRMDADDVSIPVRLEKQKLFLDNNLNISCVGCHSILINEKGDEIGNMKWPIGFINNLCHIMVSNNPVGHPNVMYRKNDIKAVNSYNEDYKTCQDMDLWLRLYLNGYKVDNIDEYGLKYRFHSDQISKNNNEKELIFRMFLNFLTHIKKENNLRDSDIYDYLDCLLWKSIKIDKNNDIILINILSEIIMYFNKKFKIKISDKFKIISNFLPFFKRINKYRLFLNLIKD